MSWAATLKVVDCATKQGIPAIVTDGQSSWTTDVHGVFTSFIDDQFTGYIVFVQVPGYFGKTFTFDRAHDQNTIRTVCLDKEPPPPPAPVVVPPRITGVRVNDGSFTVTWECFETHHFDIRISTPSSSREIEEVDGDDRSFTEPKITGGQAYTFGIRRCRRGLIDFRSNCSDWAFTEVRVPADMGYQPWRRWFPLHPETVFDHTTQHVAAVSRAPGNLDLFVIGLDNAVWTAYWNEAGGGWNPEGWRQVHPETVFDHTTQHVAAVSRAPGNLDLFVIGLDNAVWTAYWND